MNFKFIDIDSSNADISKSYWNNVEHEKKKQFHVEKFGFEKIEKSQKINNLLHQVFEVTKKYEIDITNKKILSIASGTCYIESRWLQNTKVSNFSCIDFSKHRIHELAPITMKNYGLGDSNTNIDLINGSIFQFNPNRIKYDVVFMCQAFHHNEEPIRLLRKCRKLLSEDGVIIIVGEHYLNDYYYYKGALKHIVKYIFNYKNYRKWYKLFPGYQDIFKPSLDKGDVHYSPTEYDLIFKKSGYKKYFGKR